MSSPSLVVAVTGPDRNRAEALAQLKNKLRRRGLQVHCLHNWRDVPISDFDVLLIGFSEKEWVPFAKQLEHLWTQKWNRWYKEQNGSCAKSERGSRPARCRSGGRMGA